MLAEHPIFENRLVQASLLLMVAAMVGLTAVRTYRNWTPPSQTFDWEDRGHSDFHYGTYVPSIAFRNGDSPYSQETANEYPLPRPMPPYSPAHFVFHLPLSLLALVPANVVFFSLNVVMVLGLGFLAQRFVANDLSIGVLLAVMLLVVLSRPGHQTLFTGYFTAELAIGTALALHFARRRPWLAAFGLFLTSFKPTFLIPLLVLMFCRRDFRAVIYGGILSGVGVVVGLGWLSLNSSPMEVIQGILDAQRAHVDSPDVNPVNSWVRTDLVALLSKPFGASPGAGVYLASLIPLVAVPGWVLWKMGERGYRFGASDASAMIICLAMLVAFYHSVYDCLILIAPWVAATFYGQRVFPEWRVWQRWLVILLTAVPAGSYFATLSGKNLLGLSDDSPLWQALTVVSGASLLAALVFVLAITISAERHPNDRIADSS